MALARTKECVQQEERQKKPMEVDSARPWDRAVSSLRSVRKLTAMFEGSDCYKKNMEESAKKVDTEFVSKEVDAECLAEVETDAEFEKVAYPKYV